MRGVQVTLDHPLGGLGEVGEGWLSPRATTVTRSRRHQAPASRMSRNRPVVRGRGRASCAATTVNGTPSLGGLTCASQSPTSTRPVRPRSRRPMPRSCPASVRGGHHRRAVEQQDLAGGTARARRRSWSEAAVEVRDRHGRRRVRSMPLDRHRLCASDQPSGLRSLAGAAGQVLRRRRRLGGSCPASATTAALGAEQGRVVAVAAPSRRC